MCMCMCGIGSDTIFMMFVPCDAIPVPRIECMCVREFLLHHRIRCSGRVNVRNMMRWKEGEDEKEKAEEKEKRDKKS